MQVFEHYQQLERYLGWTGEDARRVQALGRLLSPSFDALIDDFYTEIQRHPQSARVITGGAEQIARLKRTLRRWLSELFAGQYNEEYVASRWEVGKRHVDVGLDQLYTNASMSRLRRGLLEALDEAWVGAADELSECRNSLNTLLDLNLAIIEHAYHTEYDRRQVTAERLAMVGQIAGSIVEELRGPIDSAKNAIEFLLGEPEASQERQKVELDRLDRQVTLAEGVVSALNDFVRLPLESLQPVEIIECLKGALDLGALPETVRVQWDLPVEKLKVFGDPAQLQAVFSNLIRNAQDAMPKGGVLRLGATPDGDAVYVTIRLSRQCTCARACNSADRPPERPRSSRTESACAESSRADLLPGQASHNPPSHNPPSHNPPSHNQASRSGKAWGLGLGLSILHDIVSRHRGALTLTTEEGVSTTATLRLPTYPYVS